MECMFRKRKLLKTLLSLSLLCATVAVLQRLKLGDGVSSSPGLRESGAGSWPEAHSSSSNNNSSGSSSSSIGPPLSDDSEEAAESSAPANASAPPSWDVTASDCAPNWSVKDLGWFSALDARFQQYVLYRHCRYFPMLLNHPEKCAGRTHLLIVVKSAIEQHDRRAAVRRTWGRERGEGGGVRTLFLLGAPAAGKDRRNLQKLLEYEDRLFGDILQWDFMDTFFNLTLKEVNFLRWFGLYCRHGARFVFKGDDDVFVNTDNLLEFLAGQARGPRRRDLFVGDIISRALPIRNPQSKYFIPRQLHDQPYPPYAGGGGFLMAAPLARRLAAASEALPLYPIDDVYLGMCLRRLGVEPQRHYAFRTFGIVRRRLSPMNSDPCFYKNLLVIHKLSPEGLLQMWDTVHNATLTCAKKFFIPLNQGSVID